MRYTELGQQITNNQEPWLVSYLDISTLVFQTEQVHTIYQCTWPGCKTQKQLCEEIERHVREKHLR